MEKVSREGGNVNHEWAQTGAEKGKKVTLKPCYRISKSLDKGSVARA